MDVPLLGGENDHISAGPVARPYRIVAGLVGIFLASSALISSRLHLASRSKGHAPPKKLPTWGDFQPQDGLAKVVIKPGPNGLLAFAPPEVEDVKKVNCLFFYTGLVQQAMGREAEQEEGWVYGARLFTDGDNRRQSQQKKGWEPAKFFAVPTGSSEDVVVGKVFTYDPKVFREKLKAADGIFKFKRQSPTQTHQRNIVPVILADGSCKFCYWYYKTRTSSSEKYLAEVVALADQPKDLSKGFDTKGVCCPPGSPGPLDPAKCGGEKGHEVEFMGANLYVTGPKHSGRAIVIVPDVWGWGRPKCGRVREVADQFAEGVGALVVVADFFPGNPLVNLTYKGDPGFGPILKKWANPYSWMECKPVMVSAMRYADTHAKTGDDDQKVAIGTMGFCWGSWIVLHASGEFSHKLKCGVSFHPSHVSICEIVGENEEALLRDVKVPQLMWAAGNDPNSTKPGGLADQIWSKQPWYEYCELNEVPNMVHGYTQRLDGTSDPEIDREQKRAMAAGIAYFKKMLI